MIVKSYQPSLLEEKVIMKQSKELKEIIALVVVIALSIVGGVNALMKGSEHKSSSVLADGFHLLTDCFGTFAALGVLLVVLSKRGHWNEQRVKMTGGLINGVSMVGVGVYMFIDHACGLFGETYKVHVNNSTLWSSYCNLSIFVVSCLILAYASKERGQSFNRLIFGVMQHLIGDIAGTILSLISQYKILHSGQDYWFFDPMASMGIGVLMMYLGWRHVLKPWKKELTEYIKEKLESMVAELERRKWKQEETPLSPVLILLLALLIARVQLRHGHAHHGHTH